MAEFDVGVAFQVLTDEVKGTKKAITDQRDAKPIRTSFGVANVPSALTTQTLVIPNKPAAGRMWFIHRVVLLGVDGHTAAASGVGDVYAGPAGNLTADPTSQLYSGLLIPTIVEEGRYHNPVLFGEQVYVMLYSLPAQQQVQFAIGVYDYPADSQLSMGA